jgi:hypothetical protein
MSYIPLLVFKKNIFFQFFLSITIIAWQQMFCMELNSLNNFIGDHLWGLDKISWAVYEEMLFKLNLRTYLHQAGQIVITKLILSLCDMWAKKNISTKATWVFEL